MKKLDTCASSTRTPSGALLQLVLLLGLLFSAFSPLSAQSPLNLDYNGYLELGGTQAALIDYSKFGNNAVTGVEFNLRQFLSPDDLIRLDYYLGGYVSYGKFDGWWGDVDSLHLRISSRVREGQFFSGDLGRLNFQDPGGKILNQNLDGLQLRFSTPQVELGLGSGYLGFQSARLNNIRLTLDDRQEAAAGDYFAPHRLIIDGFVSFPSLISIGSFGVHGGGQIDLRDAYLESYSSWYAGVYADLFFLGFLHIGPEFAVSSGTMDGNAPVTGIMAQLKASADLPVPVPADAGFTLLEASGEGAQGGIGLFRPISSQSLGYWFNLGYSNIVMMKLFTNWSPLALSPRQWLRSLKVSLEDRMYWQMSGAAVAVNGINPGQKMYYGTEIALGVETEPLSDVYLKVLLGQFITNPDAAQNLFFGEFTLGLRY